MNLETMTFDTFSKFGLPGLILAVLVFVLWTNSKERKETAERHEQTIRGIVKVVKENNHVVAKIGKVLEGLKEIVRNLPKKNHH